MDHEQFGGRTDDDLFSDDIEPVEYTTLHAHGPNATPCRRKTRRFEQAQRDESEHAVAYAKGMEEARKRKQEDAVKRKDREREEYLRPRSRDAEQFVQPRAMPERKAEIKKEDFPALPSAGAAPKKIDTTWVPKPGAAEIPLSPPVGKWDEEVEAMVEQQGKS
ncbi:hypothetical protein N0V88_007262 [Collariella sp. IMI 366227]|nr:hypothetical protein N0V88_007262 [Collariella sp. IMI 366227]